MKQIPSKREWLVDRLWIFLQINVYIIKKTFFLLILIILKQFLHEWWNGTIPEFSENLQTLVEILI